MLAAISEVRHRRLRPAQATHTQHHNQHRFFHIKPRWLDWERPGILEVAKTRVCSLWDTFGENRGSGKTRTAAGTDSAPVGFTEIARTHDGALGDPNRNANRRDLGLRRRDVNFPSGQIWIEQAFYRGALGSPTTKGSKRILPLPKSLVNPLVRTFERAKRTGEDDLVFQTRNGTPFNDINLLHQHLKPLCGSRSASHVPETSTIQPSGRSPAGCRLSL
jgi:hypothetical protein